MRIVKNVLLPGLRNGRRYIIYAFLEVALVVVGILIAVMINDWNEARKEQAVEQKLLVNLRNEMRSNLEFLERVIHYQQISRDASFELLRIYQEGYAGHESEELDSLFGAVQWAWSFEPKISVVNSIKNMGKIDFVKDERIRAFIASFEESTRNVQSISLFLRNFMRSNMFPA